MSVEIIQANALDLPLADDSVDLVVTSPPYFGLRSYQDCGEHYDGQIGDEPTPTEFVDALIAATREMVRVVKPTGSIWVNLGDRYANSQGVQGVTGDRVTRSQSRTYERRGMVQGAPQKSLIGAPWRYAIRCIDELGLILRAEVIWSKPNGLPESVTDRVRRSHETWFHFTLAPRYFSAVDEIREPYTAPPAKAQKSKATTLGVHRNPTTLLDRDLEHNPLGKLPGSVWTIPTQPLIVPEHLGVDHFAAFPMEWPRRIIRGWSPSGVCVECGQGRRPVTSADGFDAKGFARVQQEDDARGWHGGDPSRRALGIPASERNRTITGYACSCDQPAADTTPAVVLDPFGGTGTSVLVAHALGRHGISVDLSSDYCRLARWRTSDPGEIARAKQQPKPKPVIVHEGQEVLFP